MTQDTSYKYYLNQIKKDRTGSGLNLCPQYLQEDPAFVVKALNYGIHYDFIPDIIRDNSKIVKKAFALNVKNMKYFSKNILNDEKWATYFVSENGLALEYLKNFQNNDTICNLAMTQNSLAVVFSKKDNVSHPEKYLDALLKEESLYFSLPDEMKNNEQILACVLFKKPNLYFHLPKNLQMQESVIIETLKHLKDNKLLTTLLNNLEPQHLNNLTIMNLMAEKNDDAIKFASETVKKNEQFILKCIFHNPLNLEYAPSEMKKNKALVLQCIDIYATSFKFADESIRKDTEVATKAISNMPTLIAYVDDELKANYAFMEPLIEKRPFLYKYLPSDIKDQASIFEKFFNIDKRIFADACEEIRNNPHYAYEAVKAHDNSKKIFSVNCLRKIENGVLT
jgi:hypothetical protein